jgi:hypothetical protein
MRRNGLRSNWFIVSAHGRIRNEEVRGSSPLTSTKSLKDFEFLAALPLARRASLTSSFRLKRSDFVVN